MMLVCALIAACSTGSPAPTQPDSAAPEPTSEAAETPAAAATQPQATLVVEPTTELAPTALPSQPAAIPEQRMLTLEWPAKLRQGDADIVRLTLEMDDQGHIIPTSQTEGHSTTGQVVEIPNLYETHSVYAEARLDLAGMEVSPDDLVSQTLLPGRSVTFSWSVRAPQASIYRGNVWFYLRFIPKAGGEASQIAIASLPVEIQSTNLLGMSGQPARWAGGIGSVVGSVLGVDTLIEVGWKAVKRKKGIPGLRKG
jgi:hypothetical protein